MLKTLLTAAALATAGLAASPADAGTLNFSLSLQGPYGGLYFNDGGFRQTLSPGQVKQALRYQGWQNVNIVEHDGATYRARASWYGARYTLTVSAFDGTVLSYYPDNPVPYGYGFNLFGGFGPNY
jgi:hypothetical protein